MTEPQPAHQALDVPDRRAELTYTVARVLELLPADTLHPYGSADWDALPADDPRRWAAIVHAAEAWRRYWTPAAITARLTDELARVDQEITRRRKDGAAAISVAHDWSAQSRRPSHAELQRRRAQPGPLTPGRRDQTQDRVMNDRGHLDTSAAQRPA